MTDRHPTTLVADDRSIVTARIIDAPRDLVFEAWTSAKHLAQWWGPNGFSTTTSAFEMKPGGTWRFVMHGPDGRDYDNVITFDLVRRPERLEYHHGGAADGEPIQFSTVVMFDDVNGKTRITMRAQFPSKEMRDMVVREHNAAEGGRQTIGRLAAFVGAMEKGYGEQPVFTITRALAAPLSTVWKVYSELDHLRNWWGPKGFAWIGGSLDFRPGGRFHYGMMAPNGSEMWGKFDYREIEPMRRIVFTSSFSDKAGNTARPPFAPDFPLQILNTVIFTQLDDKTMLAMSGTPFDGTAEELARFETMKPSMNMGFSGTFEQLEAYLTKI